MSHTAAQSSVIDWVEQWLFPDAPVQRLPHIDRWLRALPLLAWPLVIEFPVGCVLRHRQRHSAFVVVTGYIPPKAGRGGVLLVRRHPESERVWQCLPEWFELVGYHRSLHPDDVAAILGGGNA